MVLEESAPAILEDNPASLITAVNLSLYPFFIGILLFGLMTAVKGILPRWPSLLLVAVPIIDFIPYGFFVAQPLAGVALIWLGYSLSKEKAEVQEDS